MSKPWYQTKSTRIIIPAMLVFWYMFYRPIEVNRGPWQALDPGQPVEPVKFEVVEEGWGPVVEQGDFIHISLCYWSIELNLLERRDNDWWIWIGFRTEKETPFHSISPRLISAFVGLMEGGKISSKTTQWHLFCGGVYQSIRITRIFPVRMEGRYGKQQTRGDIFPK
jgi:hypothetical protein